MSVFKFAVNSSPVVLTILPGLPLCSNTPPIDSAAYTFPIAISKTATNNLVGLFNTN